MAFSFSSLPSDSDLGAKQDLIKLKELINDNQEDGILSMYNKYKRSLVSSAIGRDQEEGIWLSSHISEDALSYTIMPDEEKFRGTPFKSTGNGNCLFNAVSITLKGDETLATSLRVGTATELVVNQEKYDVSHPYILNVSQHVTLGVDNIFMMCLPEEIDKARLDRALAFNELGKLTSTDKQWSWPIHIIALANFLQRPIVTVFPDVNESIRPLYNGTISPVDPVLFEEITIMYTRDGSLDTRPNVSFASNHFVPIMKKERLKIRPVKICLGQSSNTSDVCKVCKTKFDSWKRHIKTKKHLSMSGQSKIKFPVNKSPERKKVKKETPNNVNNERELEKEERGNGTPESPNNVNNEKDLEKEERGNGSPERKKEKKETPLKSDSGKEQVDVKKDKKGKKIKTGKCAYKSEWSDEWGCIRRGNSKHSAFCTVCNRNLDISHMGRADVKRHVQAASHVAKSAEDRSRIDKMPVFKSIDKATGMSDLEVKARTAEIKMTTLMISHNIPLSFADHLRDSIKECFPDSKIAQNYRCGKTKTASMINGAIAPWLKNDLAKDMKAQPFTLSTDGSNDSGTRKMNPITIKLFDVNRGKIETKFLDMCSTTSSTAACIFTGIESVMTKCEVPWKQCVGLSLDNASVNMGINNSVSQRVKEKNPDVYVLGCPCHILHNTANAASRALFRETKFDVTELMVDQFYWFDKSTKRKNELKEYCEFTDVTYRSLKSYSSSRWLSLEICVSRTLALFPALKSYFSSVAGDTSPRFQRLKAAYSNPMLESYLAFLQNAIPIFLRPNKLLQRSSPSIHLLHDQIREFLRELMGRFVQPAILAATVSVTDVAYEDPENQIADENLYAGTTLNKSVRSGLGSLLEEGSIMPRDVDCFYKGVRSFYIQATQYAISHLPVNDSILAAARFVNWEKRHDSTMDQVMTFVHRFKHCLPHTDHDVLHREHSLYCTLPDDGIPPEVLSNAAECTEYEDTHFRCDVVWNYLNSKKSANGELLFGALAPVALLVLTLPHSNAEEERIFNQIKLNKTDNRSQLDIDETLSSIITLKTHIKEPCYKFQPSGRLLQDAKKTTREYNMAH